MNVAVTQAKWKPKAIRKVGKLAGSASRMMKKVLGSVFHATEGFFVLKLFEKY